MSTSYIEATQESGKAFFMRDLPGEIVMLNLLRFREEADYSDYPNLKPGAPISGWLAYRQYMNHTHPILQKYGSALAFMGDGGPFLIGPPDKSWDLVLLVRHRSRQAFMALAADPDYQAIKGHRTAALADSRLLPLVEFTDPGLLSSSF